MDTEEPKDITVRNKGLAVLDEETGEIVEDPKFDWIIWEDQEAKYYPRSGAIMVFDKEKNRWIIRANRGGRSDWDPVAMVEARELKKKEAIFEGLQNAAFEMDLRSASDVLSAVVAARAKNAVEDEGRTGNADAKFIFSLVGAGEDAEGEGPAVRIDMDKDTAKELVQRLIDM
jgi:hypothetical protein